MTGTIIFRRDCAQEIKRCKKPGLQERVRTNTQAVLRLAWGGLAKGHESVQQAEASVVLKNLLQKKEISRCNKPRLRGRLGAQGLGPGPPGAWGPGPQTLGPPERLGPGPQTEPSMTWPETKKDDKK